MKPLEFYTLVNPPKPVVIFFILCWLCLGKTNWNNFKQLILNLDLFTWYKLFYPKATYSWAEQMRIKCLAQRPNNNRLAVLWFNLTTFQHYSNFIGVVVDAPESHWLVIYARTLCSNPNSNVLVGVKWC